MSSGFFVQHPHAFKTGSAEPFRLLAEEYSKKEIIPISREEFAFDSISSNDFVILFQADFHIPHSVKFPGNVLIAPMFDECLDRNGKFFRQAGDRVFISFSKILHNFLFLNGCRSYLFKYWPEKPISTAPVSNGSKLKIFFWERTPIHVSWKDVKTWFSGYDHVVLLRQHWDPNHEGIRVFGEMDSIIPLQNSWHSREKYLELVSSADVFIAPRRWEGIGISSLEALGLGVPVVGLDTPTQNEYIKNGRNGYLVHKRNQVLPPLNFEKMSIQAARDAELGREKYLDSARNKLPVAFRELDQRIIPGRGLIPEGMTLRYFASLYGGYL